MTADALLKRIKALDEKIKELTKALVGHKTTLATSLESEADTIKNISENISERIRLYNTERSELVRVVREQDKYVKELGTTVGNLKDMFTEVKQLNTVLKSIHKDVSKVNTSIDSSSKLIELHANKLATSISKIPVQSFNSEINKVLRDTGSKMTVINGMVRSLSTTISKSVKSFDTIEQLFTTLSSSLTGNVAPAPTYNLEEVLRDGINDMTTAVSNVLKTEIPLLISSASTSSVDMSTVNMELGKLQGYFRGVYDAITASDANITNAIGAMAITVNTPPISLSIDTSDVLDAIKRNTKHIYSARLAVVAGLNNVVSSINSLPTVGSSTAGTTPPPDLTAFTTAMGSLIISMTDSIQKSLTKLTGVAINSLTTPFKQYDRDRSKYLEMLDSVSKKYISQFDKQFSYTDPNIGKFEMGTGTFQKILDKLQTGLEGSNPLNPSGGRVGGSTPLDALLDIDTTDVITLQKQLDTLFGEDGVFKFSKETTLRINKLLNELRTARASADNLQDTDPIESAKIRKRIETSADPKNLNKSVGELVLLQEVEARVKVGDELKKQTDELKKQRSLQNDIVDLTVAIPKQLAPLTNMLSSVSKFTDRYKELAAEVARSGNTSIKMFGLKTTAVIRATTLVASYLISQGIALFTQLDSAAAAFRRETGLTVSQTRDIDRSVASIVKRYTFLGASAESVYKSVSAFKTEFGDIATISTDVLGTMAAMTANFGVAATDSAKVQRILESIGGYSAEGAANIQIMVVQLARAAGVAPSAVIRDIAESAESASVYFKGNVNELAKAAVNARRLGTTLKDVVSTADKLLDFESSITAELEATAFLGGRFDLTQARALAAAGKTSEMQNEILNQVRAIGEFNQLDLWTQRAVAAATGMTVEELSRQLHIQDSMASLSADQRATAEAAIAAGIDLNNLSSEQLRKQLELFAVEQEQQAQLEKIKNSVAQLGVAFGTLVLPVVELIVSLITPFAWVVDKISGFISTWGDGMSIFVSGLASAIVAAAVLYKIVKATAVAKLWGMGPVGWAVLGAAAIGSLAMGGAYMNRDSARYSGQSGADISPTISAGDVIASARGGMQLTTQEGQLIDLSPNDDVIAAPNLASTLSNTAQSSSSKTTMPDLSPIANTINQSMQMVVKEIKALRTDMVNGKIAVYMDGRKVTAQINRVTDRATQNSYGVSM